MKEEKIEIYKRDNRGITLIALVINIIVLSTLTAVTLNLTLGEDRIFITAPKVAKNYTIENLENSNYGNEKPTTPQELEQLEPKEPDALPENTVITPNGTQVQKPADKTWDETKINSYADGAGNTIPVPVGFAPITSKDQGTKATGFVIKDVSVDSQGNPTETNGNEFVWVPVEGMSYTYDRYDFEKEYGIYSIYSETLATDEETSVTTYGGYYIGRYEAGRKDSSTLVVQKDQTVWNYITRQGAKSQAESLYNKEENNVTSKLCSSYAWDTALKFIATQNSTYPTDSTGGNYTGTLKNTGYHAVNNIYDMGGNVGEWTTEAYIGKTPCVCRGGFYNDSVSERPAGYRDHGNTMISLDFIGFRLALFM